VGNVLVSYAAGYASVPADVETATLLVLARLRQAYPLGGMPTSQSYRGVSASLGQDAGGGFLSKEARMLLRPYRDLAVGAFV
jgi:hypothetical protein